MKNWIEKIHPLIRENWYFVILLPVVAMLATMMFVHLFFPVSVDDGTEHRVIVKSSDMKFRTYFVVNAKNDSAELISMNGKPLVCEITFGDISNHFIRDSLSTIVGDVVVFNTHPLNKSFLPAMKDCILADIVKNDSNLLALTFPAISESDYDRYQAEYERVSVPSGQVNVID